MKTKNKAAGGIGRPREFDAEKALDRALEVFWRQGYEGSSLADLTKAMGINRPSMYAAFGDKESLFRRALDRYEQGPSGFIRRALEEPSARSAVELMFRGTIDSLTDRKRPQGCLLVQGALACSKESEGIRQELIARRSAGEDAMKERFRRAKNEGELADNVDADALAEFYVTVLRGMGVQAAGGASKKELEQVAAMALKAWPEKPIPKR